MSKAPSKVQTRMSDLALSPKQLKSAIRDMADTGISVFIWGPPGIGKSQILKQVSEERGFNYFEDIRLSQVEPTDVRGIPMPVVLADGTETVKWSAPDFFHPDCADGSKKGFYLFDEMNSAPQSVQAAAYSIILDRKIGKHKFGARDFIAAAGNRETDKGATVKMPKPLENRFVHLELKVDFDDWQEHALEMGFHPHVVGYLTFSKNSLFDFDPTNASRAFPTPRSWEMVSKILKSNPKSSNEILRSLIAGAVGEGVAVQFMAYRKRAENLPNPTQILKGNIKELKEKDVDIMYALVTSLCYELKEKFDANATMKREGTLTNEHNVEFDGYFNNFLQYAMDNFQPELVIMSARTALSTYKMSPTNTRNLPVWKSFTAEYADTIIEA